MAKQVTDPAILAQLQGANPPAPSGGPRQVTDPAILAQLQGGHGAPSAPAGIIPNWTPGTPPTPEQVQALQAQYGKTVSGQQPPGQVRPTASPADAVMATVNGLTGSIPGLQQASDGLLAGGQTIADILANRPGTVTEHYNQIQQQRQATAAKAPLANTLGGLGGGAMATSALSAVPAMADAMGMSGSFGKQLLNSGLFSAGYNGAQGLAQGHTGASLLADEGIGGAAGVVGSLVGQGLGKVGQTVADAMTQGAQNKLINTAVQGSNVASKDLKSAGSQLFQQAFPDGKIPMVSDNAYMRFLGDVQQGVQKIRPNAANDPQAVGLLDHLMTLADASVTPGQAIDLQDLHLARQLASKVAQSPSGRDSAVGSIVVDKIDNFIKGLKPSDILGGEDPTQNAAALMQGISTWSKAKKLDILETAVQKADGYKSGIENGLKSTFSNLIKSKDYSRFSPAEQSAIEQVAKGTPGQNLASLVGKLGISLGGAHGPQNVLGAGVGTTGLTAALTPFLGPAALPAAAATTTAAGMVGRRLAEDAAQSGANRAIQAAAVGGIPTAAQVPNMLEGPAVAANLLTRGIIPILPHLFSGSASTSGQP